MVTLVIIILASIDSSRPCFHNVLATPPPPLALVLSYCTGINFREWKFLLLPNQPQNNNNNKT